MVEDNVEYLVTKIQNSCSNNVAVEVLTTLHIMHVKTRIYLRLLTNVFAYWLGKSMCHPRF